jgi:hypothetical protein
MYARTDNELAELVVREYYKALPPRPNRGQRRTGSDRKRYAGELPA